MLFDESRVSFAIYRWKMGMEDEITVYIEHGKLAEVLDEEPIDGRLYTYLAYVGNERTDNRECTGFLDHLTHALS